MIRQSIGKRAIARAWKIRAALFSCNVLAQLAFAAAPDPLFTEHGMVVSASADASDAGVDMLKRGGNAIDAAAATAFALAVTHPQAGNIGGGGFLLAVLADGQTLALDFRETAPHAAHRDMFISQNGEVISKLSLHSPLASGVPGSVDGLLRSLDDYGSGAVSRRTILAPAIRLAKRGFPISRGLADELNGRREFFARDPGAAEIFVRADGRPWREGDVLRQRDLARTLGRIVRSGTDGFYLGRTATLLAEQMRRTNGLISEQDLVEYRSVYRDPIRGEFNRFEIVSMPPPSSGGLLLVHMLNMISQFSPDQLRWNSSAYVHILTEIQRRAYADRAEHLGDPDFWNVPSAMLISADYAAVRAADIDPGKATPSSEVSAGAAPDRENTETTHFSVADRYGNAVAVTTTLNASFGPGIVVQGAGFFLNNEMDDFSAKPGAPNLYGLVGNEANAIAAGKRMLSSMTPTIVLRDAKPYLVVGSPGGATIITTVLQVVLNVTAHGMNIMEAVAAPRHHSQWLPDNIMYEPRGLAPDVLDALSAMGHATEEASSIGQANCLMITGQGYFGAPDPRGDNAASGY